MSWPLGSLLVLAFALALSFAWYERSKPSAKLVSLVASLAALATVGRLAFAAFPNVKPTTDIALLAGYVLGPSPGFAIGALAALASNFFFGQGPWTPWQMAAWGLTGVGGATLAAVAGRRLGRVPLACACAAAGIVFGAIMDTFTLLQTGSPSVARYAAISGTSLPFNLAHAGGNAVFCLAAGPAFVRMLERYERRFTVRWTPAAAALLVGLACTLALPGRAAASTVSAGVSYLQSAQNADGGFGPAAGQASTGLETGWAVLGLRGAGIDPASVRRGGRSPIDYMRSHAGDVSDTGSLERTVLALEAARVSPRGFAGRDLVGELLARRAGDGSFGGTVNLTAFAALAEVSAHAGDPGSTAGWLERHQSGDGGFGFAAGAQSDVDDTGAVLEALTATGRRGDAAERRAVAFLHSAQNSDGGFGEMPGQSSNAQSTAWAVQGLVAAGSGSPGGALGFLASLAARDGSIRYSQQTAQTPVWVTSQALDALAGVAFPIGVTAGSSNPPAAPAPAPQPAQHGTAPRRSHAKPSRHRAHRRAAGGAAAPIAEPQVGSSTPTRPHLASRTSRGGGPPWVLIALGLAAIFALAAWRVVRRRRRAKADALPPPPSPAARGVG